MKHKRQTTTKKIIMISITIICSICVLVSSLQLYTFSSHSKKRITQNTTNRIQLVTDISSDQTEINISDKESPIHRIKKLELKPAPQYEMSVKLPQKIMNFQKPPQWTYTLVTPEIPMHAPDPFTEPDVKVNPERLPVKKVKRFSLGG
jgi:hypothetical protein